MKRDYLVYIEDILDAMEKAELILKHVAYEQFEADFRINFAAVRALEIVGEATKRLPMSLRNQYSHIPWKQMAGMRDALFMVTTTLICELSGVLLKRIFPESSRMFSKSWPIMRQAQKRWRANDV